MFYVVLQGEIRKNATVGDAQEKEQLLKGQSQDRRAYEVIRIKGPDTGISEDDVPSNEKGCDGQVDSEEVFPLLVELNVFIKTQQKWQCQTA